METNRIIRMNYLVSTSKGSIYSIIDGKPYLLFGNNKRSIYTNDISFRFIRKINDTYWYGRSEDIITLSVDSNHSNFSLPGLIDIKDMVIGGNFCAILSGLRDSVYILDKDLKNIHTCFNIGKNGNIEFFRERQMQCQEIPSNYFQVFYCPEMSNFHKFNSLLLENNLLYLISRANDNCFQVSLKDFSNDGGFRDIGTLGDKELCPINIEGEIITDYIEC